MDLYSQDIQEKKKDLQNQFQTIKKMAIGTYILIITLFFLFLFFFTHGSVHTSMLLHWEFYFYLFIYFLILKSLILTCIPKHEPPSHLPP